MSGPALSRFILITCISLISFFPINILLPSFPALSAHFDTPTADVALSISLFTLVFAISQLVAGPLSDKWGRKEVLIGCISLSILGAIGCAWAPDYLSFLLFRSVQAMGCGFFVLGHALVEDLFDEQDRARVRLYYMTLSGSFVALSPLIFMDTLQLSEYQYALVLMVYGVADLLGGVVASYLQKRITLSRQINIGLGLLSVAGVLLTLIVGMHAITTVTLLIPMLISALSFIVLSLWGLVTNRQTTARALPA
ncbi:MFS transporter [Pseudomonas sp. AF03-9]|uniref:MFS transporter n=1 Tax=Pseudomonas sp. AF03-9 TaxID=2849867 RepID=UPI001CFB3A1E|nr:MFS transporter [Pseudomonas sp. AF03-9]